MFHVPAHKNAATPAAQVPPPVPCTCGPVIHWECNAGCKAAMINNAVAAQRRKERQATIAEVFGLKPYPDR